MSRKYLRSTVTTLTGVAATVCALTTVPAQADTSTTGTTANPTPTLTPGVPGQYFTTYTNNSLTLFGSPGFQVGQSAPVTDSFQGGTVWPIQDMVDGVPAPQYSMFTDGWTPTVPGIHTLTIPIATGSNQSPTGVLGPVVINVANGPYGNTSACNGAGCISVQGTLQVGCAVTVELTDGPNFVPTQTSLSGTQTTAGTVSDGFQTIGTTSEAVNGIRTLKWTPTTAGPHILSGSFDMPSLSSQFLGSVLQPPGPVNAYNDGGSSIPIGSSVLNGQAANKADAGILYLPIAPAGTSACS